MRTDRKNHSSLDCLSDYCFQQLTSFHNTRPAILELTLVYVLSMCERWTLLIFISESHQSPMTGKHQAEHKCIFLIQNVSGIHDTILGACSMHKTMKKVCVNMGPWMLYLWVMVHFILEGGQKTKCEPIHTKVFTYKLLIPTFQITILITNYKKCSKCCLYASTLHAAHPIKDCHTY
jgi:hypothetical protein